MKNAVNLTQKNFPAEVLQSPTPVIVDFSAPWCGPCKVLDPLLDTLAGEYAGRVKVATVDLEAEPGLAEALRVQHVPTLVIYRGGAVVEVIVGFRGPGPVRALFQGLAGT
ncbi:MAG: thioredoxin domain-containing protein [Pseudomonadota bacterium]|nr:thioredoxin domain-containing protein [Pseudomonadota bacterium]